MSEDVRPWTRLSRYGFGVFGPVAVSGAHFLASLLLLHTLPQSEFGLISVLLVAVQFCFGLSNALVGTPFTVRANQPGHVAADDALYLRINAILSLLAALACGGVAALMGAATIAWLLGLFALFAVMRWFFRSYFYAVHKPQLAAISDLAYAVTLIGGLGMALPGGVSLAEAALCLAAAAAVGMGFCGAAVLRAQLAALAGVRLDGYRDIWRAQSRWALLGVVSTEAAGNAHVWLVTLAAGPTGFAPLAAASLLFRPVPLFATSLTQLERPAMARAIAVANKAAALRTTRQFGYLMLAVWALATALAGLVLVFIPRIIVPAGYDMATVATAAACWAAIYLLQAWRTPDATLLQSADRFRPLAMATSVAGLVSVIGVAVLLAFFPPVISLAGLVAGQLVMSIWIARLVRDWRRDHA